MEPAIVHMRCKGQPAPETDFVQHVWDIVEPFDAIPSQCPVCTAVVFDSAEVDRAAGPWTLDGDIYCMFGDSGLTYECARCGRGASCDLSTGAASAHLERHRADCAGEPVDDRYAARVEYMREFGHPNPNL